MELQEIISRLETFDGTFPRKELEAAIEKRDEMIPELLKMLKHGIENPEKSISDAYWGHTFASYLLAQFRVKEAYPLFAKILSLPGNTTWDLLGDLDGWDSVYASVSFGDVSLIQQLIEDESINEYSRVVALKALVILYVAGEQTREEIIRYFRELFEGKLERKYSAVWMELVCCCLDIHADEFHKDILDAYDEELVWEGEVSRKDVEREFSVEKQAVIDNLFNGTKYRLIEDAIEEMEWWACFEENEQLHDDFADGLLEAATDHMSRDDIDEYNKRLANYRLRPPPSDPIKAEPKIGRNQPCPCGSGKKYKKCCGKKA